MIPLNYLAILCVAVLNMVIGALWYSPLLFAKSWMQASGKSEKDLKETNMGFTYGSMFVVALLFSFTIAYFSKLMNLTSASDALSFALWAWFGFFLLTTASDYLFSGRPLKLYLINSGYQLILFVMSSLILTAWK